MAWIDAVRQMARINVEVFGEGVVIVSKDGTRHDATGIVYLTDNMNNIGSLRTDLERSYVQVRQPEDFNIAVGDRIEHEGATYTIYDITDDDINFGLQTLWTRRNAD